MTAKPDQKENTAPESLGSTIWADLDIESPSGAFHPDTDDQSSPEGYTHPCYFRPGPYREVKNTNPLGLDAAGNVNYTYETITTPPWLGVGRPPSREKNFWPAELVNKYRSPKKSHPKGDDSSLISDNLAATSKGSSPEVLFHISGSSRSSKRPAPDVEDDIERFVRPTLPRMLSYHSIDIPEIRGQVPDFLLYDHDIQNWCTDIIKKGATLEGIKTGINLFATKTGHAKPNGLVLNIFGVYLESTIGQLTEVKMFFEQYHRHLLQRELEKLHAKNLRLATQMEEQKQQIEELRQKLQGKTKF
ncbi:hypothetical protein TWF694_000255 [Orbilia ellipsospora]|uniref:Uncharacterized protein n=1 Tax=Orbilia ellipsospora TaxID=2528407 RepID=A0AAV9XQL9_9PEZI